VTSKLELSTVNQSILTLIWTFKERCPEVDVKTSAAVTRITSKAANVVVSQKRRANTGHSWRKHPKAAEVS